MILCTIFFEYLNICLIPLLTNIFIYFLAFLIIIFIFQYYFFDQIFVFFIHLSFIF